MEVQEQNVAVLAIIKTKAGHLPRTTKWLILHMAITRQTVTVVSQLAIALKMETFLLSSRKKIDGIDYLHLILIVN